MGDRGRVVAGFILLVEGRSDVGEDEGLNDAWSLGCGSADGDAAEEVIADVVRVVGVDQVERRRAEGRKRGDERRAIRR